jgi:hypothetical protein
VEGRKEDWCCLCSSNGVVEEKEEEKVLDDSGPWESVGVGVGGGVRLAANRTTAQIRGVESSRIWRMQARQGWTPGRRLQDKTLASQPICDAIRYDTIRYDMAKKQNRIEWSLHA